MNNGVQLGSVLDVRFGLNPNLDAWLMNFMIENNLDHSFNPEINASFEQLRFMVVLEEDQVYAPCPDHEFLQLLRLESLPPRDQAADGLSAGQGPGKRRVVYPRPKLVRVSSELQRAYNRQWRRLARLIHDHVQDTYLRRKIMALCRYRLHLTLTSASTIPARLMKRLLTIFLTQTGLDDPYLYKKIGYDLRVNRFLRSKGCEDYLYQCPDCVLNCHDLRELRFRSDLEELFRWLALATWSPIWEQEDYVLSKDAKRKVLDGCSPDDRLVLSQVMQRGPLKILYLPDHSGSILLDLQVIKFFLHLGHRVILCLKEGFCFQSPTFWDRSRDPVLEEAFTEAHFVHQADLSKNELLKLQREHNFLVISDGTRERLNFYRTSITFARAWKESDLIVAKGWENYDLLLGNAHYLTRDVLAFFRDQDNALCICFKAKSKWASKYTEKELLAKAEEIIREMRQAKAKGKKVMFYSAIVGSIPGETQTAIQVLSHFVAHLRAKLPDTYIVNPAEHFEQGMDADDLMFMWERVQRSGLIDVWRFQSVEDIEKSFELMGRKVPPTWIGKDATFSTGCTKEMHIALDMQKHNPELQIIGPDPENFFRRREYGVGKFFDTCIGVGDDQGERRP